MTSHKIFYYVFQCFFTKSRTVNNSHRTSTDWIVPDKFMESIKNLKVIS